MPADRASILQRISPASNLGPFLFCFLLLVPVIRIPPNTDRETSISMIKKNIPASVSPVCTLSCSSDCCSVDISTDSSPDNSPVPSGTSFRISWVSSGSSGRISVSFSESPGVSSGSPGTPSPPPFSGCSSEFTVIRNSVSFRKTSSFPSDMEISFNVIVVSFTSACSFAVSVSWNTSSSSTLPLLLITANCPFSALYRSCSQPDKVSKSVSSAASKISVSYASVAFSA